MSYLSRQQNSIRDEKLLREETKKRSKIGNFYSIFFFFSFFFNFAVILISESFHAVSAMRTMQKCIRKESAADDIFKSLDTLFSILSCYLPAVFDYLTNICSDINLPLKFFSLWSNILYIYMIV